MSGFDEYVKRVTDGLDLPGQAKTRICEEALSHLEDEKRRCIEGGKCAEEAEKIALRKFGEADVIKILITRSMASKERKYKRRKMLLALWGGAGVVLASILVGVYFNFFDDLVTSATSYRVFLIVYIPILIASVAVLIRLAAMLTRMKKRVVSISAVAVIMAFILGVIIFDMTPLANSVGYINGQERPVVLAFKSFGMRLWVLWFPTLVVGGASLFLRHDLSQVFWLENTFAVGFVSAVLWGVRLLYRVTWFDAFKPLKYTSTGLLAVAFVMLVWLAARSMGDLGGKRADAAQVAGPENPQKNNPDITRDIVW